MEEGGTMFTFEGTSNNCSLKTVIKVHSPHFYWKVNTFEINHSMKIAYDYLMFSDFLLQLNYFVLHSCQTHISKCVNEHGFPNIGENILYLTLTLNLNNVYDYTVLCQTMNNVSNL